MTTPDRTTGTSRVLLWDFSGDAKNVRSSALRLRKAMATHQIAYLRRTGGHSPSPLVYWRRQAMRIFPTIIDQHIFGRVLEIGAGAGWCSADLSRLHSVDQVFCLDYETTCVNELMPLVHSQLAANTEKITRVLGSFNSIRTSDNYFDFIYSMGAIHHSENLSATMRELFRVLRPGGYVLALERCEHNTLTVQRQHAMEQRPVPQEKVQALYGTPATSDPIKEIDNSNHFFRLLDYEHASLSAGFEVFPFTFDLAPAFAQNFLRWIRDARLGRRCLRLDRTYNGFSKRVHYPFFALQNLPWGRRATFDRLMLVLRRPSPDLN